MRFGPTCKEVTHLVLQGEDRVLGLRERLAVRLHMLVCQACPRFAEQVRFMRRAMGRWKQYAENDSPPP